MKLLLDANVSWRLAAKLKEHFDDCVHINRTSLPIPAKDSEIWDFAQENNFMIVTNDEDFLDLMMVKGFPPKVILLRTGNQTNASVESLLIKHKDSIRDLTASDDYGLLELY